MFCSDRTNIIYGWFCWTGTVVQWARGSHGNSVSNHSKSAFLFFPFITWFIHCWKDFPHRLTLITFLRTCDWILPFPLCFPNLIINHNLQMKTLSACTTPTEKQMITVHFPKHRQKIPFSMHFIHVITITLCVQLLTDVTYQVWFKYFSAATKWTQ